MHGLCKETAATHTFDQMLDHADIQNLIANGYTNAFALLLMHSHHCIRIEQCQDG
jgi:predicted membrane channel-forming protein YqfA (hemolysin III family)